jgi:PBP1b-binding outer membrane lipoprotein LpoB
MSKKTSLILVAGAALFLSGCNALKSETPADTTAEVTPSAAPGNFDGQQLMKAFEGGEALSCTMTNTAEGGQITFITKNKKHRSSTNTPESPGTVSHMINDGEYMYLWNSDQTTGFKSRIPTEAELKASQAKLETVREQAPDFTDATVRQEYANQGYSMNCVPTEVADSEFVPPTNIQFQDMSALMQKTLDSMPKNIEGMPKTMELPADN